MSARPAALVTGARRGIGRATCAALAARGFDVVGADLSEEGVAETAEAVEAAGGRFAFRQADVAALEDHAALLDAAWDAFGGLECLVNNAGVGAMRRGDLLEVTRESWDRAFDVNVRAGFFLAQGVARRMLAAGAPERARRSIVFVSSANATLASPERGEYAASKAAVSMVARVFALRLAEEGIAVHEIRPGVIRTDMTAPVAAAYDARIAAGLSPIRRWGEAEDVGRTIALLAAGDLPFTTGDAFHVDGGLHLGRL
ncbi:3-ketoacyl-ACP reductase [Muricoccus pecuniae]|uniref:NAD(P)-dependent dehydrogenase (Short-subunit alcohol dehydrogenase family) n=1 Tax=Muricoccus pecuniae TaxID=693023 RepID=A0A840Y5W2_9PROT|nr:3-ketoacyl-ACP reductase [Roseomonas pecuniae]MBB5695220.1 NAD(P)-dependent dehydrogenase (short-subunit alcohol dehydrogenase family) [Roseomonas pecuniae]